MTDKIDERNGASKVVVGDQWELDASLEVSELPARLAGKNVWLRVTRFQFIYSVVGLSLGLICVLSGVILFLRGVGGNTHWILKLPKINSSLSDAAPGTILFVVGLFIIFVTRFAIRVKK